MPSPVTVTFVVPVYFEQEILPAFYKRLAAVMDSLAAEVACDVLFVDDGSRDDSPKILAALAEADPRVGVIFLSRNFGHQLAITAGLDHARGDAVVTLDSDLQDPPEVTRDFIAAWRDGAEVVIGTRRSRRGESRFKLLTARVFYRLLSRLSDVPLVEDSGDFRLLDRRVVDALKRVREQDRYLRGIISWLGFRQVRVPYDRDARTAGETKYPLGKMLRLAIDGISSFSDKPLRLAAQLGLIVTVLSVVGAVWIAVGKLLQPQNTIQGWTSVMVVMLFLGGVQLLSVGILGEYVGRIFRQTKDRPLYLVARQLGPPPPGALPAD
ncbi:MAG TPA: glycosyltransferase family 2 protein [Tepidisphaeraceae bacterium]|jgi:dolichol-phosphate mannosyltransferase